MKTLFLIINLLTTSLAFGQITKTIYKTFKDLDDISTLNLRFGYETEVEEWNESRILVETTVRMTSANKNILKFLIDSGRYDLKENINGSDIDLEFSEIKDLIVVKGQEVWENLTVVVFAPKRITVNVVPPPEPEPEEEFADEDYGGEDGEEEPEYWDGYEDPNQVDENLNYFDMYTPDDSGAEYEYEPDEDYDYGPSDGSDQVEPPKK